MTLDFDSTDPGAGTADPGFVRPHNSNLNSWLSSIGLSAGDPVLDGVIHRVDGQKKGKKSAWYVGWDSPIQMCIAGDWSTNQKWEWRDGAHERLSRQELRLVRARQKEAIDKAYEDRVAQQLDVAEQVAKIVKRAPLATTHSYLQNKRIEPHGILVQGKALLVPAQDVTGMIWGAQRIYPDGSKRWFPKQRVSRTFFRIGELHNEAFICEGFATGASIHEATGLPVFVAWASGNLKVTAVALAERWPGVRWTIAGDNDKTEGNPGKKAAEAAARALNCAWVLPTFTGDQGTDFNDLMRSQGAEAVRIQLQGAQQAMAEVTDLNEERRKRKKQTDEMSTAELHLAIAQSMAKVPGYPVAWPPFPHAFHVAADDAGRCAVLEEVTTGIVQYRDEAAVIGAIVKYCYNELKAVPGADVSHKSAVACKNLWLSLTTPLATPPDALLERSAPGLAFRRLPFDAPPGWPGKEPPIFEEFLSRCSKPLELCAFIGSLFFPQADRQQYLYIYGHGLDGKGSLLRLLFSLMGPAAQSLQPKSRDDRFWNMKTYGKRLVMFPDCDDFRFFGSPEFKSLTGNDPLFFEEKGKPGFSAVPTCKIIAASNQKPNISSQKSDLRRLMYVEVRAAPDSMLSPTYEKQLAAESEAIVRTCKEIYLEKCPEHGPIPCDYDSDIAIEAESSYLDIFDYHFVVEPNQTAMGNDVRKILHGEGVRDREIKLVKECWERVLGVRVKHSEKGAAYVGMRKKTAFEINRN